MYKKILWCVPAIMTFFACSNSQQQETSEGYVIKGSLKGIDSGMVKLSVYNGDDRTSKTIDSAVITNGSFELKGKIGSPKMVTASIEPGNWAFSFFAEDTVLSVTADTTGSSYYDYTAYGDSKGAAIKNFTVTGSKANDDWMKYQDGPGKEFENVFKDLNKEYEAAKNKDEQYKVRDKMDSVRKVMQTKQKEWIDHYVAANPSSVAGVYMFNNLYTFSQNMPVATLESMLNKFEGSAKASSYYASMAKDLAKMKAVQPGSVAPDFTLLKRDSTKFTLSSTRGKYIMIDFWASWCHPCRQAIPHWKKVYEKYHDKGFDIVSVSNDFKWADWKKAMDVEKMPWIQVCDEFPVKNMPATVGSLYMTHYIPFYVLLDKEGKILVYSGDEKEIDKELEKIFG